jgi:hypothetical protein
MNFAEVLAILRGLEALVMLAGFDFANLLFVLAEVQAFLREEF